MKRKVDALFGLHAASSIRRTRADVLAGRSPLDVPSHRRAQKQPIVRVHPVTGRRALYLCEYGQMDWVDGPILGMESGPNGAGAELLSALMAHITQPQFVYTHEWTVGDVLVWDNRCLVHCATWYDVMLQDRTMWRTTVGGNPGAFYAGMQKSWMQAAN